MAGEIKISGLASGIAFDELVSKMIEAESFQARKLETWKKTWQVKIDTLKELSARVQSLTASNNILKQASSFITRLASSTNNSVADIAVDSTAMVGSYKVEVADKVKHKLGSTGINDISHSLSGSINFIDASGSINTMGATGDSVQDLVNEINANSSIYGFSADIQNDGSSYNQYRLILTSLKAGSDGSIKIIQDNSGLSLNKGSFDDTFEGDTALANIFTPTGAYTGHTSKRINFSIETGGSLDSGNVRIRWEDPAEGRSGVVTVPNSGSSITLFQGLTIDVDNINNTVTRGQMFSLDVYAPDIQVAQDRGLAQSAQMTHNGLSSNNAIVTNTDGVFQYTYRGVESSIINVPAGTTLTGLVKLINEAPGNPGIRASVINDGMGTAQSFHLILTGVDSGAANQITIVDSTLSNMTDNDFQVTRQATNAIIKIDDFPLGDNNWIQRSSNLVTDIITGASIRLKDIGVVNFTITNNEEDMADKVQSFIDEYNTLLDYIDEITKVVLDSEGKSDIDQAGVLTGNYAVNMLRSSLRGFVGSRASGFSADNDIYSLLTQVGLSSSTNGRINFEREEFKRALNENPEDLIKLFSAQREGSLDNNNFIYIAGTNDTKSGIYDFNVNYDPLGNITFVSYKDKVTGKTYTSTGNTDIRISENGKTFTVFAGSARGAAIQTVGNNSTVETFSLTVKDGKSLSFDEELKKLFDENSGITKVLEKNYENIIRNIDVRIDREMMRVEQVRKRLEKRFANLEVNMQNWNGQMERLQQQLGQLQK